MGGFLLTVETEPDKVVVYSDPAGFRHLIGRLELLLAEAERKGAGHDHWMTPDWAGTDLTSTRCGSGTLVHHIKVCCDRFPQEGAR